ncbi:MAG: alanine/ornithine racemase family PLP-dependent enzyme [Candidatus Wallbacteria bacterium]|nr:alanine/ornithine racemase family PLP-dependent enzyme [Candidatus Wallbacteria bacterium]
MSYPRLLINVRKLEHNVRVMLKEFNAAGITIMGVNKVFNGMPETADAIIRGGIETVAESRVENLKKIRNLKCKKCLLRSPAPSDISATVSYADISIESEEETIKSLSAEAVRQGRTHEVLLMVDMGDLREGIWHEDFPALCRALELILTLPGLKIYGLGTNFNCYGTLLPTYENGMQFVGIARRLEEKFGIRFPHLSGGNCTSHYLLTHGTWPPGINHLRIGGTHQFGIEYVNFRYLEGFHHSDQDVNRTCSDLYLLQAEILELSSKPTKPVGPLGLDAFLKPKTFVDRGIRKRAIMAFGRQDMPFENIWPVDQKMEILGQTSDHTIIDIEDSSVRLKVGDIITFQVDYTALLQACSTPGIEKMAVYD